MGQRIYYGWNVVGSAFVSHFLSYGTVTVAFGVFFPFMAGSLGWSRGLLASVVVLARGANAVAGPFLGPRVDHHGPRLFVLFGGISLGGGAALLALVHSPWQLFLAYGVLMALGAQALGELTADSTVAKWFVRRRGRALAFSTMGMSAAGVALPVPLAFLITLIGWRDTWVVLGIFIVVLSSGAAWVIRRRPEDYGMLPDGVPASPDHRGNVGVTVDEVSFTARQALRTPAFWLLVASTNLASFSIFGVNLHLFSYITDKDISLGVAAGVLTYLYFLQSVAKPIWGLVAERIHVRYCLGLCYGGGALGVLVLLSASSLPSLIVFATVYGLTRGAQSFVSSLAWSDYFGRGSQGAIRGAAAPLRFISNAGGPVLGGLLFDLRGDYVLAFSVFVVAFALAGAAAALARPPRLVAAPVAGGG